jgi:OPT family oligopeptide transporter
MRSESRTEPPQADTFEPYVAPDQRIAEFTAKALIGGAIAGILFGAATVYLSLKSGLSVSASIPIAVIAISIGRKLLKTTILENNIIQTGGSAGESIAAGVVFTVPGFLMLSRGEDGIGVGASYFNYLTIFLLATFGGMLGTLMMIPLRRSLIVKEHGKLPYPEGTACAHVLIAGEKGGDFAKTAFQGVGFAFVYAILQKIFHVIAEAPSWTSRADSKTLPAANVGAEITPEYLGVGYIIGPRIGGVLVAGGVMAALALTPLLQSLVPPDVIAAQLVKLGYLADVLTAGGTAGWDPVTQSFAQPEKAIYHAYIRQIGAGAVAAGGFITLLKTLPTIVSSFKESVGALREAGSGIVRKRTEDDLSIKVVVGGTLALVLVTALLPQVPGDGFLQKLLLGFLIVGFGFFFVTVSSRIVGIIGSSSNPISGMAIATLMATCLLFGLIGWTGRVYEPMALVVGAMVCIAAANAGATSQDLKTGYIVGGTPKYQQIALFIGAIASAIVIGLTLQLLDTPTPAEAAAGIQHAIGTERLAAPQGTLMATLIKGMLSNNLDWQFVLVGAFLAITIELCGVSALSFAVGAYLPLATTLPIFAGSMVKGIADWKAKRSGEKVEDADLGTGSLFATGLVAGGSLMGVIVALVSVTEFGQTSLPPLSTKDWITGEFGAGAYSLIGVAAFLVMAIVLYRVARKPQRSM